MHARRELFVIKERKRRGIRESLGTPRATNGGASAKRVFRFDWKLKLGTVQLPSNLRSVDEPVSSAIAPAIPATPLAGSPAPNSADHQETKIDRIPIDPLYFGRLDGKVPAGWTLDGWLMSLRDRLRRVHERGDERVVARRLEAEMDAILKCDNPKLN